jgi:hypothetical protein
MTRQDMFDVLAARPRHRTPDDPEGERVLGRMVHWPTMATTMPHPPTSRRRGRRGS